MTTSECLKASFRARGHRIAPFSDAVGLRPIERNLAPVQTGQRPSDPFCTVPECFETAPIAEVFPKVHPWVEVAEDEPRLLDGDHHRTGDQHAPRYPCIAQTGRCLEVGLRSGLRRVEPARKDPRLRRLPGTSRYSQHVAVPTAPGRIDPAGLDPRMIVGKLRKRGCRASPVIASQ